MAGSKNKGGVGIGVGNTCHKYFNCRQSPGQLALSLCHVLVLHLLVSEVSASPFRFT